MVCESLARIKPLRELNGLNGLRGVGVTYCPPKVEPLLSHFDSWNKLLSSK